jgi:cytochrome c oxidase cbb3-type subunit 3
MTRGWSIYVITLVVLNLVACLALLWGTSRRRESDPPADQTGHLWDGDLTEYNKPLPRWWINLFYLTIIFSIGYLAWYPGLGNFTGYSGWSSAGEHDTDKAAGDKKLAATFSVYDGKPIQELARDPHALALGKSVFANQCATCHGSMAQGALGFPNLTDNIWHWGGEPEQVLDSVLNGRNAVMPAWSPTLIAMGGATALDDVASYVLSLSTQLRGKAQHGAEEHEEQNEHGKRLAQGKQLYDGICIACHGAAGKGNPLLGAPDLTDDYWLYGNNHEAIYTSIGQGRNGVMPAHKALIGDTRARLAAAYVWSLSQPVAP